MHDDAWLGRIRFDNDGLVPVAAQARLTGELLMLAWADRTALVQTRATGLAHYWSRSRQTLWRKGETSGHEQRVREIRLDCDGDTVLYQVDQTGPACHTGTPTCFSRVVTEDGGLGDEPERGAHLLTRLAATIARRAAEGGTESYTARLLAQGIAPVSQKVGEEAVEVVVAANAQDNARLASESADLLYHLLVLLEARGVPLTAVLEELARRER